MKKTSVHRVRRSDALLELLRSGENLTVGQQITLVVLLSVPAMLAQLSNIVMEYIDAAMVGSLGAEASASIGLVSTSTWLVWGLAGNSVAGFNVLVAHRVGGRDYEGARAIFRQGLCTALMFSVFVGMMGFAVSGVLPRWLGGEEDICGDAGAYFGLVSMVLPMSAVTMLCSGALRSSGNVIVPSVLNVVMCVLDIFFNFMLIFPTRDVEVCGWSFAMPGAGLGVRGAAIGTGCAEGVTAVLLMLYIFRRSKELGGSFILKDFLPRCETLTSVVKISLPMVMQHLAMTGAQVVSTTIVAPLGKMSLAANSFGITAESLCYMPGYGVADAAQTIVGQSIGAKRRDLTRHFAYVSLAIGMGVMTLMGVVMYVAAPVMMGLLSPVEEIRHLGVEALRIEAFAEPMFAAAIVCYGVFVGAGDTLKPCLMNLVSMWGVRLTLAWWLAPSMGLNGAWTAMCIELCFRGVIFLLRLRFGGWEKSKMGSG